MGSPADEERRLLLLPEVDPSPDQECNNGPHTADGSVDINGNPAWKHKTGRWRACSFILGTEFCERLAYYGIGVNLITYLTKSLHEDNASAARNITTWQGTCYLSPLIGAFLADSYWGKYGTIAVFSTIYLIGMVTLTLSVSVPAFKPPSCDGLVCPKESSAHTIMFFSAIYTVALGAGGIKPCVSSFGADQFDDSDTEERTTKGSFFNWFYFCINVGSLMATTFIVWIQDNYGWSLGFAIPTFFIAVAIGNFFFGAKFYRFQKPSGSPLTRVCQVVVASLRKWNTDLQHNSSSLYELPGKASGIEGSRKIEHTEDLKFLDKAAVVSILDTENGRIANPWRLCTVTQVEELKILIRMLPIFATSIVYSAVYAQVPSLFLEQGMVLDTHVGSFKIPPASLITFDVISIIIWIPIYDRVLVPIARRYTGKERGFSELQRIGIGLFLSILAMSAAALVEMRRLAIAKSIDLVHQKVEVPMSILWQLPQHFLVGTSEVFTAIGQGEFFYNQSPDAMRSLCSSFALLTVAFGSYLCSFILTVVTSLTTRGGKPGWIPDNLNEGHLDYFFWLIGGLSSFNLLVFVYFAMKYKYKVAS